MTLRLTTVPARLLPALALAVVTLALPAARQDPRQATFRADVTLVRVDVVVRDEHGRPVRGLTKDRFEVRDRGVPQPIELFEEIDRATRVDVGLVPIDVRRDVASNQESSAERLVILAIDDTVPSDRLPAIASLGRQVVDRLGPGASMALLTASTDVRVEVTGDLSLIRGGLDRVESKPRARRARTIGVETGQCAFGIFREAAAMLDREDVRRKALIFVSPYCAIDYLAEAIRLMDDFGDPTLEQALGMIESFRRSNVAFYAIDPRGAQDFSLAHFAAPDLVTRQDGTGIEAWRISCQTRSCDPVLISQDNLNLMTAATSGFAVTDTDDLAGGLDRLVEDFDHYYTLGFYATGPEDGAYRPLQVSVGRPAVSVRFRQGYRYEKPRALGVRDPLLELSVGVLPRTDLPLRVFALVRPTDAKTLPVEMTIDVGAGAGALSSARDTLDISVLAVDLEARKVVRTTRFERAATYAGIPATGGPTARVRTTMPLPPGRYQLRVSARSELLGKSGSVYHAIEVPRPSKSPVTLGDILIARPAAATEQAAPAEDDQVVEPLLDRTFSAGDRIRLIGAVWRKDPKASLEARVTVLDAAGPEIVHLVPALRAGSDGRSESFDTVLGLDGLAPGWYRLRVSVSLGRDAASREIGFEIR